MYIVLGRGFIGTAMFENLKRSGAEAHVFSSSDCNLCNSDSVEIIKDRVGPNSVDGLILCASKVRLKGNTLDAYIDNIKIAMNVARLLAECKPKKFMFLSTIDVYGYEPELPITAKNLLTPFDFYGKSKLVSETILTTVCETVGVPYIVFRLAGVFGPMDKGNSAISHIISICESTGEIQLSNSGLTLRDYVFIDDLVRLTQRALKSNCMGTFNAVSGKSQHLLEIVETIVRVFDAPCAIALNEKKGARDYDLVFDQAEFISAFGDFKFTALEKAILAYRRKGECAPERCISQPNVN